MVDFLIELQNEILEKKLKWVRTPSNLNPPEMTDVYQQRLSLIDSLTHRNNNFILNNQLQLKQYKKCYIYINNILKNQNKVGYLGKVSFWKILKYGRIGYHTDTKSYHKLIDRYILNFTMKNEMCHLLVDGEKINLNPGEVTNLMHWKPHCVENNQLEDVYFLSFDVFKNGGEWGSRTPD